MSSHYLTAGRHAIYKMPNYRGAAPQHYASTGPRTWRLHRTVLRLTAPTMRHRAEECITTALLPTVMTILVGRNSKQYHRYHYKIPLSLASATVLFANTY